MDLIAATRAEGGLVFLKASLSGSVEDWKSVLGGPLLNDVALGGQFIILFYLPDQLNCEILSNSRPMPRTRS